MLRVRSLELITAIGILAGCYRWSAPQPAPLSAAQTRPAEMRVTLVDGRQFVLEQPRIQGDSLFGVTSGVALRDVGSVSVRRLSVGRTALLVVAIPLAVVVAAAVAGGCCIGHIGLETGR